MRLSESDAGFLYGETASASLQTAGIAVVKGAVSFEAIYKHVEDRLHLVPSFRRRAVWVPMNLAHPKWVDDPDFDLKNHIVHHPLPPGSTLLEGIDEAVRLNEGLMNRDRPLWKYVVITGIEDRTLLLQQVHHAMIDGASAIHLSTVMFDYKADADAPPAPTEHWNPAPLPTAIELMTEAFQENTQALTQANPFASLFSDSARTTRSNELMGNGMQLMSRFITEPVITAPWNAQPLGPKRKMRWSVFEFDALREIRKVLGGTVNDVVLTTVSEGAARYLELHREQTQGQQLRIMCPVNVRAEGESGALGNKVSAMFPMVPAWPMDLLVRHKATIEETQRIKEKQEAQAMTLMQESGVSTPPVALAPLQLIGTPWDPTALAALMPVPVAPSFGLRPPFFGVNFVCTNVPGVQVPQYIAGHEILDTTAIMMMSGTMGYGLAVTSYNKKMIYNYTCEPRLLPDLEVMVEQVEAVFAEMLELAKTQKSNAA